MKSAYIHHWGLLWVAGKNIRVKTRNVPIPFDMPVGATYTLESRKPVSIDGVLVRPGEAVGLSPGRHELSAKARGSVTLRYETRLPIPDVASLSGPVFERF